MLVKVVTDVLAEVVEPVMPVGGAAAPETGPISKIAPRPACALLRV
jgi:hypothetical protein